jgi:ribosome maturation protein Sdo1
MAKTEAHPKENGIVPNKEGTTGATKMMLKVDKTHFIIVIDDTVTPVIEEIQKFSEKVSEDQLDRVLGSLAIDDIYADKVGDKASSQQFDAAFNTTDKKEIMKEIIVNGKFH